MNKKLFSKAIILTAIVLLGRGELFAQETTVTIGYCETRIGSGMLTQDPDPGKYGAAVFFPHEMLDRYAGAKITKVDFAIIESPGSPITVFVTKDLDGTPLATKEITDYEANPTQPYQDVWNSVVLDTPVAIESGVDLYVGYTYIADENTSSGMTVAFDFHRGGTPNSTYVLRGDYTWTLIPTSVYDYDICIRAFATGNNLPGNDISIRDLNFSNIIYQNNPTTFNMKLRNYGATIVNSVETEVTCNGNVIATKTIDGLALESNDETTISVKDINFDMAGNAPFTLSVTKVNGMTDENPTDNSLSEELYIVKEGAEPKAKKVLFEQFASEKYEAAMIVDEYYANAVNAMDNVIWVNHHVDDKFEYPEIANYVLFFDDRQLWTPNVLSDRSIFKGYATYGPAYFIVDESYILAMFKQCSAIPTYIQPILQLNYDKDSRSLGIKVACETNVTEMPLQKQLRLTTYLVEDGVVSSTQSGMPSGKDYTHNGIVRKIVSDVWGDEIDIATSGNVEKIYNVTLDEEWNAENMRVVAFVNNYDPTNPDYLSVYNAEQAFVVPDPAGIESVKGNNADMQIYNIDGTLTATNGTITTIYDLTGKQVDNRNLTAGMYIVKVTDGTNVTTRKYIVK